MQKNGTREALDLRVLIEKERRIHSAPRVELDVAAQGRTIAAAKETFEHAREILNFARKKSSTENSAV